MPTEVREAVILRPHHAKAAIPVLQFTAIVQRLEASTICVQYGLDGDLSQLRIPPPGPPRRAAGLWQHTCFEFFVAERGMPGYHEFNFAPSGEWAVHAFSAYRRSIALADGLQEPQIRLRQAKGRLELDAIVCLAGLVPDGKALAASVTAVLEDRQGGLSYWAVNHAAEKPDFHRVESFTLEIDAIRN